MNIFCHKVEIALAGFPEQSSSLALTRSLNERPKQPTKHPFNGIHENSSDRLGQIKAYHTYLAVTSICMAVNKIHDLQICPNLLPKAFVTHLICVIVSEVFDRGSRLNSS